MKVEAPAQRLGQDGESGETVLPGVHVAILKLIDIDITVSSL
jgi:hypothetical protein